MSDQRQFEIDLADERKVILEPCSCCDATEMIVYAPEFLVRFRFESVEELSQFHDLLDAALEFHDDKPNEAEWN